MRADGRDDDENRPVVVHRGYSRQAAGSVLLEMGGTRVICTASVTPEVPAFLVGTGKGWLTAEYAMLPASTSPRKPRDRAGKVDGRSVEIQRLIGRSLRSVVRLDQLGERTVWIDCDVLDADGGTRTASITGAFVALVDALTATHLNPLEIVTDSVAAVSVGMVAGQVLVDLDYGEDSKADVDMNLVMTSGNRFIELQGTAERTAFSPSDLNRMLEFGQRAIGRLTRIQETSLGMNWRQAI